MLHTITKRYIIYTKTRRNTQTMKHTIQFLQIKQHSCTTLQTPSLSLPANRLHYYTLVNDRNFAVRNSATCCQHPRTRLSQMRKQIISTTNHTTDRWWRNSYTMLARQWLLDAFRIKHPINPICFNSFRFKSARNAPHSESNPDLLRGNWEKSDLADRFL